MVVPPIGRLERAGPLALGHVLLGVASVVAHVGPRQAGERDHLRGRNGGLGHGQPAPDQCGDDLGRVGQHRRASQAAIRVAVGRRQRLVLAGVAKAQGQVEGIAGMPGVVGEQGEALGALLVTVLCRMAEEHRAERAARGLRQEQRRGRAGGQRRVDAAEQRNRQVRLVRGADAVGLVAVQVFVGVEGAHQPVHRIGGAAQAELLTEGVERAVVVVFGGVAVEQVGGAEVEVEAVRRTPLALGGDRGQRRPAEPRGGPVGLQRHAAILDPLAGAAVAPGLARVRVGDRGQAGIRHQSVDDRGSRATDDGHAGAAILVPVGDVGGQVQGQGIAGIPAVLCADRVEIPVEIVGFAARANTGIDLDEAVTAAVGRIHAQCGLFSDGQVEARGEPEFGIVAGRQFRMGRRFKVRTLGDHVDHAGRGVLAEQGALRPLQHLDALQLAEVAEAHAIARAVDPVDDDADRGFQAGVVAHGPDAADAGGGQRLALGAGHGQAGHQHLQVLHVADAAVLEDFLGQRGHHDRHVLQGFLALLRGDDQLVERLGFSLGGRRAGVLRHGRQGRQGGQRGHHGQGEATALGLRIEHVIPL